MQEHKLCVLVLKLLMGILIRMRETEIVASDTLPGLNYYKNAFATGALPPNPIESLIAVSCI